MKKKNLSNYDQIMEIKTRIGFSLMLLSFLSAFGYGTLMSLQIFFPAVVCLVTFVYSMIACYRYLTKYGDRIQEYLDKKDADSPQKV